MASDCILTYALALFTGLFVCVTSVNADTKWLDILRQADESRGNMKGVTWEVSLRSREGNKESELGFDVKARAFDSLSEHVFPPREKGKKLLMVNGNMWFYKPGITKPVPISTRQKLMGNAAYGDIASTNYAEDYRVESVEETSLDGRPSFVFDLRSTDVRATYDRIVYWVDKAAMVGVKAEYYTVSGKKFKSAAMEYENSVVMDRGQRPFISKMEIFDEAMSSNVTTLEFNRPKLEAIPDHVFNLNLLAR